MLIIKLIEGFMMLIELLKRENLIKNTFKNILQVSTQLKKLVQGLAKRAMDLVEGGISIEIRIQPMVNRPAVHRISEGLDAPPQEGPGTGGGPDS